MKNTNKFVFGGIGLFLLAFFVLSLIVQRVPPSTIGVKQNQWGGGGIEDKDYEAGFHLGITGIHRWYLLDKRTHFVTFSDTQSGNNRSGERPSLRIRTRDNNEASVDVSLTYRIIPGEAHAIVAQGDKEIYRERVISTVESVLKLQLARLSSEEFYSTETRLNQAKQTLPELRSALEGLHVIPDQLLIRAVRFQEGYERRLQEKQLTRQKTLLAKARERVEKQLQETGKLEKEIEAAEKEKRGDWEVRLQNLRSTNEVEIADISSEADLYDRRTRATADADFEELLAEGKLALDTAEALRNDLRNQALDTLGGRILLARRAAENLTIESVTLNSNDPSVPTVIDIPAMVKLLVGEG
ncbi:MAG: SPFH domain-containing protein, partial [Planctomycetota bacterium]